MNVFARISVGELIDKLTILEIKLAQIVDDVKRRNILREYEALSSAVPEAVAGSGEILQLRDALKTVNQQLSGASKTTSVTRSARKPSTRTSSLWRARSM